MVKFQFSKQKTKSAEKISQQVFYIMIGLAVLVFGLFFLVGYDLPFEENPDFSAPLFTDVLILLMWLFLIGGVGLAVFSMIRDYRSSKSEAVVNGVPVRRIFRNHYKSNSEKVHENMTYYCKFLTTEARKRGFSTFVWDNNHFGNGSEKYGIFDRFKSMKVNAPWILEGIFGKE